MSNIYKEKYLNLLKRQFGQLTQIGSGYSLYHIPTPDILIYFRYSKILGNKKNSCTFYGLRKDDIDIILSQAKKSFIILLSPEENKNLFIPFGQFESYFHQSKVSSDKQYKVNHYFRDTGNIIYFSNIGRFSTEKFRDFDSVLDSRIASLKIPQLSHGQVQSLLGSIGIQQKYDLFFPSKDYNNIDFSIVKQSALQSKLPHFSDSIDRIVREIDVIWLRDNSLEQFFEVEHSTPIYSGLLRFNDVLISLGHAKDFNIVAEDTRENKFGLEINRPTFIKNNLIKKTTFLSYESVYRRYVNLTGKHYDNTV